LQITRGHKHEQRTLGEHSVSRGRKAEIGDTNIAQNGYHYTRTEEGWVLTHRMIAEQKLGRKLADNERVKFKDKDRTNFDPDNIIVFIGKEASKRRQIARLNARIDELIAQRDLLLAEE
jgi:hypothetical protein